MTGHCICPGSLENLDNYMMAWNDLDFAEGFNGATALLGENLKLFDPPKNRDAKLVYVYRNPLDQAVSYFRHMQNHKNQDLKYYTNLNDKKCLVASVSEYVFVAGLDSYIKQYLTWKLMKEKYYNNIFLIKYEELVRNPISIFKKALLHLGHDVDKTKNQELFAQAIRLSSKDSMKNIENLIGHALGNDQIVSSERHVRDGLIGKWKNHLSQSDLIEIEKRLSRFYISLSEFTLE